MEQLRGSFHFCRRYNIDTADAIISSKMIFEPHYIWIIAIDTNPAEAIVA
jgi:hypothetical protein